MSATILLAVAVIPTLLVMFYVYRMDKIEKESRAILMKVFLGGMVSTIPAIVLETLGEEVCVALADNTIDSVILEYLVIVPFAEEICKRLFVKNTVWKNNEFNYTFDAIVYCVFGSMGFACLENIFYVFDDGVGTGLMRAVTSIPGHAIFGLYMGIFFGKAKVAELQGNKKHYKFYYAKSLLIPVLLHGLYDFLLTLGETADSYMANIVWFVFIIILDVWAVREVKEASDSDQQIRMAVISEDTVLIPNEYEPVE